MARQIPEVIEPGFLLIPTGHDVFSVISAAMPNGDSCVRINGSSSPDHGAFMELDGTSQDIDDGSDFESAHMSFWFRQVSGMPNFSAWPNATCDHCLLNWTWSYAGPNVAPFKAVHLWADRIAIANYFGLNGDFMYADGDWDDGEWHMVHFGTGVDGSNQNGKYLHVDLTQYTAQVQNQTQAFTGSVNYEDNAARFGIGNTFYDISDNGQPSGVEGVVDIAHIARFSQALNSNQRLALWDAMQGT